MDNSTENAALATLILMTEHINELLTEQPQLSAQRSYDIALQHRHSVINVSHVFLALLDYPDEILLQVFDYMSLDVERLKAETLKVIKLQGKVPFWQGKKYKMSITPLVKQSIDAAIALSKELKEQKASSAYIFWGVVNTSIKNSLNQNEGQLRMCRVFHNNNITSEKILQAFKELGYNFRDELND